MKNRLNTLICMGGRPLQFLGTAITFRYLPVYQVSDGTLKLSVQTLLLDAKTHGQNLTDSSTGMNYFLQNRIQHKELE